MKTIKIADTVKNLVPNEFKDLPDDADYRLTKVESSRPGSMVYEGDTISGSLEIVDVKEKGKPGVRVTRFHRYIRTSPIVEVLDKTDTVITFKTEGGVYKLERLDEET
jgi:hypothetical protein